MASATNHHLPNFNFRLPLSLTLQQRFEICLEKTESRLEETGQLGLFEPPAIPDSGASEEEILALESCLQLSLPEEYRQFLKFRRYLILDDGFQIHGLGEVEEGIEYPWLIGKKRSPGKCLVFADYWAYGDGDYLMFDLTEPGQPVLACLHEYGSMFARYAPSFSLALWRMVHELEF
ncbi:Hypothetical protein PBC10988_22910 [Planctomycetales bacterium 10988]|nr:Hypothetical protein PBC10988_22910 [Planctomycetales bacterium 10988]